MTAYLAVAYEYAVEMTYPLPEGTAAGLLNLSAMVGRNHLHHWHIFDLLIFLSQMNDIAS